MKRYLRLITIFAKYSFIHATIYKEDFIIWSLVDIGWFSVSMIFFQLLFTQVDSIAGWSKPEVFLLQGIFFLATSVLWGIFWNNFRELPKKINTGSLDFDLIRPIDAQFMISFKELDLDNINGFILGFITTIYAIKLGHISFSPLDVLLALIAFILGLILFYSLYFFTMCFTFWFDRIENLPWLFPSVRDLMKIPAPFFKGPLRILFVYLFPVILITTLPSQILLHIRSLALFPYLMIVSISSILISRWFFYIAIKRYASASS